MDSDNSFDDFDKAIEETPGQEEEFYIKVIEHDSTESNYKVSISEKLEALVLRYLEDKGFPKNFPIQFSIDGKILDKNKTIAELGVTSADKLKVEAVKKEEPPKIEPPPKQIPVPVPEPAPVNPVPVNPVPAPEPAPVYPIQVPEPAPVYSEPPFNPPQPVNPEPPFNPPQGFNQNFPVNQAFYQPQQPPIQPQPQIIFPPQQNNIVENFMQSKKVKANKVVNYYDSDEDEEKEEDRGKDAQFILKIKGPNGDIDEIPCKPTDMLNVIKDKYFAAKNIESTPNSVPYFSFKGKNLNLYKKVQEIDGLNSGEVIAFYQRMKGGKVFAV